MTKTIKLGLVASSLLLGANSLSADSLNEALANGKVSGDVTVAYESRDFDTEVGTYYQNTAWSVGSVGLNYTTGTYNNFSASLGYRGYLKLYEGDDTSSTNGGTGDANDRIKDTESNDQISKAYIEYKANGLAVQVGRKDIGWGTTDWITKIHQGAFIQYKVNDNLNLEALYSDKRGRVYAHELFPFADVNGDKGMYQAAGTYKINDNYSAKAYYIDAPDSHSIMGGKLTTSHDIAGYKIGSLIHLMQTSEDVAGVEDGEMTELQVSASRGGIYALLGYVKTGSENGWGSAANAGDMVVWFEEGDSMYYTDAETLYLYASKSIADISLSVLYGSTSYRHDAASEELSSSELDIWASHNFSKNLSLSLGYSMTNEDSKETWTTDMSQLNAKLKYTF